MGIDTTVTVRRGYIDKKPNSGTQVAQHLMVYVTTVTNFEQQVGEGEVDDLYEVIFKYANPDIRRGDALFDEGQNLRGGYYRTISRPEYFIDGHLKIMAKMQGI